MQGVSKRTVVVLLLVASTLFAAEAYAGPKDQSRGFWRNVIVWIQNEISLPPG